MEQAERDVFELLDLGFGRCRMVLATVEGDPDPAAEALRRLGVMRVATKYPRIADALLRAHRPPGRDRRGQGLGRARAAHRPGRGDRRPHRDGHDAARERPRRARGDRRGHGAAHRQPGRAQAQGRGDRRRSWGGCVAVERLRLAAAEDADALAAQVRALVAEPASVAADVAGIVAAVRERGDAALLELVARLDAVGRRAAARDRRRARRGARAGSTRPCAAAWRWRSPTCAPSPRRAWAPTSTVDLPQGQRVLRARAAGAPRRDLRARAGAPRTRAPSSWASSPPARPACEEVAVCAPGAHPVILAACALCGVRRGLRMGGAHAIAALAYGTASVRARRRHRRARAASTCRRPSAWSRATSASTASTGPATCSCSPRPARDPELVALDLLAQAEHGAGTVVVRGERRRRAARRRRRARGSRRHGRGDLRARRTRPTSRPRWPSPRRSPPSTSSSSGAGAEALAPRVRRAGCVFVGAASGDGVRRLRRRLEPRAAHRRRGALRLGAVGARASAGA